jgi:hypothetical protein
LPARRFFQKLHVSHIHNGISYQPGTEAKVPGGNRPGLKRCPCESGPSQAWTADRNSALGIW